MSAVSVSIAAVIPHEEEEERADTLQNLYGSSFRTFDARSYECLATIDVKKSINDLCTGNTLPRVSMRAVERWSLIRCLVLQTNQT
mgnify:CR=1 FL=1